MELKNIDSRDGLQKPIELDEILLNFKLTDRYHLVALIFLSLSSLSNNLYSPNYVYVAPSVAYGCHYDECNATIRISNTSIYSKCDKYLSSVNHPTCAIEDYYLNQTEPCKQWDYEDKNSLVAEFDLGCQDWKRTLIGSVRSFGLMLGLLITGPLSDRYGRKILIVCFGVLGAVFGVARALVTSYWLYIAFEFLEAFIGNPYSPMWTMAVEIAPSNKRILMTTIINIVQSFGFALAVCILWLIPYWRNYLIAIYAPSVLHILFMFFIDESPRWLISKGKTEKAKHILKKAAAINKLPLDHRKLDRLQVKENPKQVGLLNVLKITFKSRILIIRFIVCCFWWISGLFINYGGTLNLGMMEQSVYLKFSLQTICDIIAYIVSYLVQKKFKRKKPLIYLFLLAGLFYTSQGFFQTSVYTWLPLVLYMGGRIMTKVLFAIIYLYTSELFPTYTRNTMHAVISSVGRIGSILAPQTPLLIQYWNGLPSMLFGTVSILASLFTILAPDAEEVPLPDNVKEAENFGN